MKNIIGVNRGWSLYRTLLEGGKGFNNKNTTGLVDVEVSESWEQSEEVTPWKILGV
jgi:hypothetical protein